MATRQISSQNTPDNTGFNSLVEQAKALSIKGTTDNTKMETTSPNKSNTWNQYAKIINSQMSDFLSSMVLQFPYKKEAAIQIKTQMSPFPTGRVLKKFWKNVQNLFPI